MRLLFLSSLLGVLLMNTTVSFAGKSSAEGQEGRELLYDECSGELLDGTTVTFQVRPTIVPSVVDSVLLADKNQLIAHLYCEKGGLIAPDAPSAGENKWNCGETDLDHHSDGGFVVKVLQGGVVGATTAQIFAKQIHPFPPQHLGILICK